jgi:hypothetical protein
MKIIYSTILLTLCFSLIHGQSKTEKTEQEIKNILQQLADANLKSDTSFAEKYFANNLLITSQSGKVYSKKDSLLDIKNPFEKYENSDFKFVHLDKKTVLVNYQNIRKRKTLDEAKFRVTTVWRKNKLGWQIVSLQSSRITQSM